VNARNRLLRDEEGQVLVFVAALLTVLIGMGALVLDVGSWFKTQRHLQTAVDAAALAGAQKLPISVSEAQALAVSYAQDNYAGLTASNLTFPSAPPPASCTATTCIKVVGETTAPGFLAKIFGSAFDVVDVHAKATAGIFVPSELKNVAPVAVKREVACAATNPGCYGQTVTLDFRESDVASSTIGLIDLTCHSTASTACGVNAGIGGNELADWIRGGYADALPSNQWYGVKTGQTIGPIRLAFEARLGVPLFFPVFDLVSNDGPNYYFHIIGWAAFVITNVDSWSPSEKRLTGYFATYIATDLAAGDPATGAIDYGVHVISLVE
jgi:hypothetical protein